MSAPFTHFRFAGGLLALLIVAAGVAFAGPPLICHTFDIGSAKSLPWISHDWNLTGSENYDTSKLVTDTLTILAADPTVSSTWRPFAAPPSTLAKIRPPQRSSSPD